MVETLRTFNMNDFNSNRLKSIDIFRGFTILLMIFVNLIAKYQVIPNWSKHGVGYTITYVDLVLPLFLFIMTLGFGGSYQRRLIKSSKKEVLVHFIRRYLLFIVIGLLFTIDFSPPYFRWGSLQVLGLSGLFLLPIIEFSRNIRLIIGGTLIIIHQFFIIPQFSTTMSNLWAGGIYSFLGWGGMMMISSVIAESLQSNRVKENLFISAVICTGFGLVTIPVYGLSMVFTTIPYILFSLGICTFSYLIVYIIFDDWGQKRDFFKNDNILSIIGKNALILYLLHVVFRLISSFTIPWDGPLFLAFTDAGINMLLISIIALLLFKKQRFIKL